MAASSFARDSFTSCKFRLQTALESTEIYMTHATWRSRSHRCENVIQCGIIPKRPLPKRSCVEQSGNFVGVERFWLLVDARPFWNTAVWERPVWYHSVYSTEHCRKASRFIIKRTGSGRTGGRRTGGWRTDGRRTVGRITGERYVCRRTDGKPGGRKTDGRITGERFEWW
jgi:hypothetical protein